MLAFQTRRLRRVIAHAYDRVPYYRALFRRHGIEPRHIRTAADLRLIPTTSRRDLQRLAANEIVAEGIDPARLIVHTTSGSSGMPLSIRRTWLEERLLGAVRLRALHHYGARARDTRVTIHRVRPPDVADTQLPLRLLQAVGLFRMREIDCLLEPPDLISALRQHPPDVLAAFPGVLSRVAMSLGDDDRRLLRPRLIVTGGEVLTAPMRRQISQAFRARVFDTYASHEFNLVAWECKETGDYHVADDSVVLEVLDGDRPAAVGERGEVTATSLHSFAMPFLRYRLGDIVTRGAKTCPCGRPFSVISAIQGRMIDYFPLPDGRQLHPYEIVSIVVRHAPWIQQYRLIQEAEDRIRLQAVAASAPSSQELTQLEDRVGSVLGPGVVFVVALVPRISPEPSGKFRVSRSLVSSGYDGIEWEP